MTHKLDISRRGFLTASLVAGAGAPLLGCSEKAARYIIPQVIPPDDAIPGLSLHYRSVCRECPAGCGLQVRTREGRPVKLEGNPDHPINRGALCAVGQAALDDLYAPDRLAKPMARASGATLAPVTWDAARAALLAGVRTTLEAGKHVAILTRVETGILGTLLGDWLAALGQSREQVVTLDPTATPWHAMATRAVFGTPMRPRYQLARAEMVLAIGDDLVDGGDSPVEYARDLADLRARPDGSRGRVVYAGPRMSLTAATADQWISLRPGTELFLVGGIARAVLDRGLPARADVPPTAIHDLRAALAAFGADAVAKVTGVPPADIATLAGQLLAARTSLCTGPGPAVAGTSAVPLAALIHLLNAMLGNLGETVHFEPTRRPSDASPQPWDLDRLTAAARAGEVGALLVHHADPLSARVLPSSAVRDALGGIPFLASFTNRLDETAQRAQVVLCDHHALESWGTVIPRPGITGIQQPAMKPLHDTRAAADVLLDVARALGKGDDLPSDSYAEAVQEDLDEQDIAHGGTFEAAKLPDVAVTEHPLTGLSLAARDLSGPGDGLALVAFPSVRHAAGRAQAPDVLEDLPDPITSISWSPWAELHPTTAGRLGITQGEVIQIRTSAGKIEAAADLHPCVREDVIAVPAMLAGPLFADQSRPGLTQRATVTGRGRPARAPRAAGNDTQEGRELAREVSADRPSLPPPKIHESMYPEHKHPKHRWGMAIDLDRCNGCSACVVACVIENNSPIAGLTDSMHGRRMAWLRMERFFDAPSEPSAAGHSIRFLPMMCQQCCNAPCESVCPVYATYHNPEGINAQVYNRCVGTRYCENNCPYHARRFNWWDHEHPWPSNLGLNPDVTVRERGVTEKCTFCYQRIREAEENAKMDDRPVHDGEITPACAQTCPTTAIAFGDLNDPGSRVSKLAASGRAYHVLEELNTEPGVSYLARVRETRRG